MPAIRSVKDSTYKLVTAVVQNPSLMVRVNYSMVENRTDRRPDPDSVFQQNIVALRPIRGEMFIESVTSVRFFPRSSGAKHSLVTVPMMEKLRSAGARVIELEELSINISLPWSED